MGSGPWHFGVLYFPDRSYSWKTFQPTFPLVAPLHPGMQPGIGKPPPGGCQAASLSLGHKLFCHHLAQPSLPAPLAPSPPGCQCHQAANQRPLGECPAFPLATGLLGGPTQAQLLLPPLSSLTRSLICSLIHSFSKPQGVQLSQAKAGFMAGGTRPGKTRSPPPFGADFIAGTQTWCI